jgi:hypothetical protein
MEKSLGEIGIRMEQYRVSATLLVFRECDVYFLGSVTMSSLA